LSGLQSSIGCAPIAQSSAYGSPFEQLWRSYFDGRANMAKVNPGDENEHGGLGE
jgi:hypothetical protein